MWRGSFFRAELGVGAVEDFLDGGEGLLVGEVAGAAHDALFQVVGAVAGLFHVGIVIRIQGEEINTAEMRR